MVLKLKYDLLVRRLNPATGAVLALALVCAGRAGATERRASIGDIRWLWRIKRAARNAFKCDLPRIWRAKTIALYQCRPV